MNARPARFRLESRIFRFNHDNRPTAIAVSGCDDFTCDNDAFGRFA